MCTYLHHSSRPSVVKYYVRYLHGGCQNSVPKCTKQNSLAVDYLFLTGLWKNTPYVICLCLYVVCSFAYSRMHIFINRFTYSCYLLTYELFYLCVKVIIGISLSPPLLLLLLRRRRHRRLHLWVNLLKHLLWVGPGCSWMIALGEVENLGELWRRTLKCHYSCDDVHQNRFTWLYYVFILSLIKCD